MYITSTLSKLSLERNGENASGEQAVPKVKSKPRKDRKTKTCAKCRNHGVITKLEGHKHYCKRSKCDCDACKHTSERQFITKVTVARNRARAISKQKFSEYAENKNMSSGTSAKDKKIQPLEFALASIISEEKMELDNREEEEIDQYHKSSMELLEEYREISLSEAERTLRLAFALLFCCKDIAIARQHIHKADKGLQKYREIYQKYKETNMSRDLPIEQPIHYGAIPPIFGMPPGYPHVLNGINGLYPIPPILGDYAHASSLRFIPEIMPNCNSSPERALAQSSKANESFHHMVTRKFPKDKNYSTSTSGDIRVASAVLVKNDKSIKSHTTMSRTRRRNELREEREKLQVVNEKKSSYNRYLKAIRMSVHQYEIKSYRAQMDTKVEQPYYQKMM